MKAAVITKQGKPEVIEVQDIEKPKPKHNEVLINIQASSVTVGDTIMRKVPGIVLLFFALFGVKRKKITGMEVTGIIEEIGSDVSLFNVGDQVFGTATMSPTGGNADYVCLPEKKKGQVLVKKPNNVSFEEIVTVPIGGMTALYILKQADLQKGQKVLVYGASGSVGTYAVQLAKHFGAIVTGVCSTTNIEMVKSIGADKVIDYTKEDFTENGESYDVVFDAVRKMSKSKGKKVLKENGIYLSVAKPTKEITEDLVFLRKLVETGKLKAVIDRKFTLDQIVEAHRYVETGRKKGNVIITH